MDRSCGARRGVIDVTNMEKASFMSPLGRMNMYADHLGVTKIEFIRESKTQDEDDEGKQTKTDQSETTSIVPSVEESLKSTDNAHLQTCLRWLDQYFKDPTKLHLVENPLLKMNVYSNKSFLVKVWQVLRKGSKPGELLTYMQVAEMAGNSKAGQSVGLAMRRNPFPILVPCHRVVRANAKIGNYCWLDGMRTKKWLLDHEKKYKNAAAAAAAAISSSGSECTQQHQEERKTDIESSDAGSNVQATQVLATPTTHERTPMSTIDATAIGAQATGQ